MDHVIRPGRPSDLEALRAFTTDTFSWGDYVPDRFLGWLDASDACTVVAVDDAEAPIAVSRAVLLSPTELWLHATRVHPDHRREGIGTALGDHLLEWGRSRGAHVARLAVEDWNEPAQAQVAKSGYRPVSKWVWARRAIVDRDPRPTGNGGKRVGGHERLKPAPPIEAEAAFLAWSASPLMRMARGLFGFQWRWRRLTIDDLTRAARDHALLECPSGWAMATQDSDQMLIVSWMMSTPDDTFRLVRAVLDRAVETNAGGLGFQVPATVELATAFERIGCEMSGSTIWERAL